MEEKTREGDSFAASFKQGSQHFALRTVVVLRWKKPSQLFSITMQEKLFHILWKCSEMKNVVR